jgi:hypothetical protein
VEATIKTLNLPSGFGFLRAEKYMYLKNLLIAGKIMRLLDW